MTAATWDQLVDLYVTHGDPSLPENAALLTIARHEVELERLARQGRL